MILLLYEVISFCPINPVQILPVLVSERATAECQTGVLKMVSHNITCDVTVASPDILNQGQIRAFRALILRDESSSDSFQTKLCNLNSDRGADRSFMSTKLFGLFISECLLE